MWHWDGPASNKENKKGSLTSDLVKERQGPMSSLWMRLKKAEERSTLGFSFHSKNSAYRTESSCKKETINQSDLLVGPLVI